MEEDIIFPLDSTDFCCAWSLNTKRTVSTIPDRINFLKVLTCSWKNLVSSRIVCNRWITIWIRWSFWAKFLKIFYGSAIMGFGPWLADWFWAFSYSALCLCIDIFVGNPLIRSSLLERSSTLNLNERNACSLSWVIVVEQVISFHKLMRINVVISQWNSAQVYCLEDWWLKYLSLCCLYFRI